MLYSIMGSTQIFGTRAHDDLVLPLKWTYAIIKFWAQIPLYIHENHFTVNKIKLLKPECSSSNIKPTCLH